MTKYRVELIRIMPQTATFYVDADNSQAAELRGLQWAKEKVAQWHDGRATAYKASADLSAALDRRDRDVVDVLSGSGDIEAEDPAAYDREAEDQQRISDAREGFDNE